MLYLQFLDSEIKFIDRREGIKKWGTKGPHPDQVQVETETKESLADMTAKRISSR